METRRNSILMTILGVSTMFAATYIGSVEPASFMTRFLFVLLEPAGWFTTWFALDKLFYTTEKKRPAYLFYKKMSRCEVAFSSY